MSTDYGIPRLSDQPEIRAQQLKELHARLPYPTTFPPDNSDATPLPTPRRRQPYTPNYITPQISPLSTSGNVSPTSPKNYVTRHAPPMYMPAVLRPTEFPSKAPLPKPKVNPQRDAEERSLRPNSSYLSLAGLGGFGRLSRRSTGDSGKCVDGNWNLDMFPKPTGLPTRKHWKPDQEAAVCDDATCIRHFSYFTRRHHCRRCGNIFCDSHSVYVIPLDQDANYNPRGIPSRSCAHCYSQFKVWRSRTNSQSSSLSSSQDGGRIGNGEVPTTPISASPTAVNGKPPVGGIPQHMPDAAMSVPRDWNWSTF
ncbi:vacuolar segregation protein pep7 [Diplogelasinospora grovesii]|uniref:Vacuolar segregation protein pep7 n=1 Tax=Diplogelasinospora grovesii TaxID=303347 RepID=A0AAN6S3M5_9PEZI|nr:vacuolar segregation protein pep7 [Diplogelasinospora grovesii]